MIEPKVILVLRQRSVEVTVEGPDPVATSKLFDDLVEKYGSHPGACGMQKEDLGEDPVIDEDGTVREPIHGEKIGHVDDYLEKGPKKRNFTKQQMGIIKRKYAMMRNAK